MNYYYIETDLMGELERELCSGGIVKDTGTGNMFYAKSISDAINNKRVQLSQLSIDIVKAYIDAKKYEYITKC